jgi:hypothetical protein
LFVVNLLLANEQDPLAPARIEVAGRLRSREVEFQETVFAHVRSVVPDAVVDGNAQLVSGLREAIAVCIDCGLESVEQGAQWSGTIPPAVATHARFGASSGVSLTTAICRCVAGYTLVWRSVLDEVAHHDFLEEQRLALLLQMASATGSFLARVLTEIADAHSSEIRRRARSHEQRRAELVHMLLAGEQLNAGEFAELGYDVDGWHLAVIATGMHAGKAVRSLTAGLGCELLQVAHGPETVWAWLGGQRRIAFADVERILLAHEHLDISLATGEPARGVEGWRQTHYEAEGALLVARYLPRKLTRYLDVALDATALQDDAFADSLIETYLSPLDGMRIGGRTARRTLQALLEKTHNVSSAASSLGVARSTVHRQRNEIEQRLGYRLHDRQAEIEAALRIEALRKRCANHDTGLTRQVISGHEHECALSRCGTAGTGL